MADWEIAPQRGRVYLVKECVMFQREHKNKNKSDHLFFVIVNYFRLVPKSVVVMLFQPTPLCPRACEINSFKLGTVVKGEINIDYAIGNDDRSKRVAAIEDTIMNFL
jgi:hypothetical protein